MKINNTLKFVFILLIIFVGFKSNGQGSEQPEFKTFRVDTSGDKLLINWSTVSVDGYNYFEIEKSRNGKDFKTFAYVLGADPQKAENEFGYYDKLKGQEGKLYYRIKHVDENGEIRFSDIQGIKI